jgi:hypothetical protein
MSLDGRAADAAVSPIGAGFGLVVGRGAPQPQGHLDVTLTTHGGAGHQPDFGTPLRKITAQCGPGDCPATQLNAIRGAYRPPGWPAPPSPTSSGTQWRPKYDGSIVAHGGDAVLHRNRAPRQPHPPCPRRGSALVRHEGGVRMFGTHRQSAMDPSNWVVIAPP